MTDKEIVASVDFMIDRVMTMFFDRFEKFTAQNPSKNVLVRKPNARTISFADDFELRQIEVPNVKSFEFANYDHGRKKIFIFL